MTRSLHLRCGRRYKKVIFLEKESSTFSFGFEDEEDAKERFYIRRNVKIPSHFDTVGYERVGLKGGVLVNSYFCQLVLGQLVPKFQIFIFSKSTNTLANSSNTWTASLYDLFR